MSQETTQLSQKRKRKPRVQSGIPWTREETTRLIESFEINPTLWDVSIKEYLDTHKKENVLIDLAYEMNRELHEVKTKWQNLKCQYNGEVRKMKTRSGQAAGNSFVSHWEFFQ